MKRLVEQIKSEKISNILYFCGEEVYLINRYIKYTIDKLLNPEEQLYNLYVMDKDGFDLSIFDDICETASFMEETKVIYFNDIKLTSQVEVAIAEKIPNLSNNVYVIIKGAPLDKRKKLFKKVEELGLYIEINHQSYVELKKRIAKHLKKSDKVIREKTIRVLIDYVGEDLSQIINELDKLISFVSGKEIKEKHIYEICSRSIDRNVYELINSFGQGDLHYALKLYDDLLFQKVEPSYILYLISSQFELMYEVKLLLSHGNIINEVAKKLGLHQYRVKKIYEQGINMSLERVSQLLNESLKVTSLIRLGVYSAKFGADLFIVKSTQK